MRVLILTLLLASPALAQNGPPYDGKLLSSCLEGAGDNPRVCIGKASDACMAGPGGDTTVGMVECLSAESKAWDNLLNASYGKALTAAKAADAELMQLGSAAEPAAPVLQQAQRDWIAFRDASCRYASLQFQGGTAGGPAAAGCMMELTADQALRLGAMTGEQGQ
ncbi:lysozyme inhibitor LprI family protein [Paracoccus luteus]|uniref:lysozyme inhibitor LprI family protein n=1 Tax=Paracoccus luteus TaxID=2508543 RepID=UPI00106F1590|nr:lysozyme inhibitor LprI family protein [Paracoccus luteus]